MDNLLANQKFEDGIQGHECLVITPDPEAGQKSYVSQRGEINPPRGWRVWYVHDGRSPAHDPDNDRGWCEPEARLAPHEERVLSGQYGYVLFTFFRIHDGGLFQQVSVTPGDRVRFSIEAHAWTSSQDDPSVSAGVKDADYFALAGESEHNQVTFWVGIDPTGGTDPFADTVTWGPGAHIYNAYHEVPAVEAVAKSDTVTVFTRGRFLWPLKHCDQYYEDAVLTVVEEGKEDPEPEGYDARAMVVDYGYIPDPARRAALYQQACERGIMVGPSHDHARTWPPGAETYTVELPDIPVDAREALAAYYHERSPRIKVVFVGEAEEPTPDPEPKPEPTPDLHYDYPVIEEGTKLHPHAIGEGGSYDLLVAMRDAGHPLPIIKLYCRDAGSVWADRVKELSPETLVIARMAHGVGGDVEGLDPWDDDPEAYMRRLKPIFDANPDVDWWELWNEQDPPGTAGHVAMAEFAIACMDMAEAWGVKLALMSHSTGVPEDEEWRAIWEQTDFFQRAKAGGHILSLHAYGETQDPDELTYHLLRPMTLYEEILIPNDCVAPYVFTEYSIDEERSGQGITNWDIDDLMDEYATMDDYLSGQWYCLGASIFTFGIGWDHYNHNTIWTFILDLLLRMADRENTLPPEHQPNPQPEPTVAIYSQRDPRWADADLGASGYTMGGSGCAVTAATMVASQVSTMDPGEMVRWLNDHDGFTSGGLLWWSKIAEAVEGLDFVTYHTWREPGQVANLDVVREVLAKGPAVMQVDFDPADSDLDTHFVTALWLVDGDVAVADPWTGEVVRLMETYGRGRPLEAAIFALAEYRVEDPGPEPDPEPEAPVLLGFNDHLQGDGSASAWMQERGLPGLIVAPVFLGESARNLDYAAAFDAGIRVIANLRYGWSTDLGGSGTLPLPGTDAWGRFVEAAVATIQNSTGIWGYTIGNEANNPREFPAAGPLTPEAIIETYNAIRARVKGTRLAPGALDPYNAQAGDPWDWIQAIYDRIHGAEFVTAHGYVRGPEAALVGSPLHFSHAPLTWQYLNFPGSVYALLDALPISYEDHEVYVTEFNHMWRTTEGDWGWVDDKRAAEVLEAAYAEAQARGYHLAVYRWAGDEWEVHKNAHVLDAVERLVTA